MTDNFNPSFSFEFKNSKSLFENLLEEFTDFENNTTKSRFAINCAINAWHLTDWTFQEYYRDDERFQDWEQTDKNSCKRKFLGVIKYQQYCVKQCPELEYMRLITNGSKHCILNDKQQKEKTKLYEGAFSKEFSREFDISRFVIENDGTEIDFHTILEKVIEYWKNQFAKSQSSP